MGLLRFEHIKWLTRVRNLYLVKVPVVPVKNCKHPEGPPISLPHAYCVTLRKDS